MDLEVGSIFTGKVTGITKFGAFVTIAPGKSGLVHISEIANTYVSDVREHLTEGQEVNVKVISIDPNGRINLSIKATLPPPPPRAPRGENNHRQFNGERGDRGGERRAPRPQNNAGKGDNGGERRSAPPKQYNNNRAPQQSASSENSSFDDMLKRFMQDSDSKISGLYTEKKSRRRGNGGGNRGYN